MFGAISPTGAGVAPSNGVLTGPTPARDDESRLAATLRRTHGGADANAAPRRVAARTRSVVAEIIQAIEARLPGRVSNLWVEVEKDQFTLHGVSSSYYVKQVAGHLAMNAMEARLLGRLSNEIEVRTAR